jgi:hypothetical protein
MLPADRAKIDRTVPRRILIPRTQRIQPTEADMRARIRRTAATLTLVLGGAYVMAGTSYGCDTHFYESFVTGVDFCFVFDCQNGALGGTLDPCAGVGDTSGQQPWLRDCPGFNAP